MLLKPKGSKTHRLKWLDVEFLLIPNRIVYEAFINDNNLHDEDFVNDMFTANGNCIQLMHEGLPHFIVSLFDPDRRVLYHEALHLTHMIMEHKGIPTEAYNSEVVAYLQGYIAEWIAKKIDM